MTILKSYIGQPVSRVDGQLKVKGEAKYAAEFNVPGLLYGVVISSPITKGKIVKINADAALSVEGVLQVFTHENRPDLAWFDFKYKDQIAPPGSPFRPLYNNEIKYNGQPVALVVAETFELARYAAKLIHITYEVEPHETNLKQKQDSARAPEVGFINLLKPLPPKGRGQAGKAFVEAPVQVLSEHAHGIEHHNPLELFATTVVREDDGKLTIYDKTQGVPNSLMYITQVFGLSGDDVRILSPFVGGGFGSGLRPQYQLFMAVMASLELKRSVRVSLTRQQMFTFGHRPTTLQWVALGASEDGKLEAIMHEAISETSRFEDYTETIVNWSGSLYQCDNVKLEYKLVPLDMYTPMDMRAPGAATGVPALEIAMDELAYKLGMDPLELRLKNYAEFDQNKGKPYSSKELRECYRQGAERFGWANRTPEPSSMKDGNRLVGWGMATGTWDALQMPAKVVATLSMDGKLTVGSATADIGTGTYTIMTQIAAETLGLSLENVTFKLGDTSLPLAPVQGGSYTAGSVGSAVRNTCEKLAKKLFQLAQKIKESPFATAQWEEVQFSDGHIQLKKDPSQAISFTEIMRKRKVNSLQQKSTTMPDLLKQRKYTRQSHSAIFAEVKVDPDFGTVQVTRVVSAIAAGRILNPKTARSQILGAVVWGISKALEEESVVDHQFGRIMNHNLGEYHVPVNADIYDIDVLFVEEHDEIVNPLGVKGLGEIGIVGVPAAIANAIFHATGKRIHELPITLDKVLLAMTGAEKAEISI